MVATRESAIYSMYGLTNAIYYFDVKCVYISSTNHNLRTIGKDFAIKFGVFVDATMAIDCYSIGEGAQSDEVLFRMTTVGQALLNSRLDVLGWPTKFQWRHDSGRDANDPLIIKECGAYIVTDGKIQGLTDVVLRPFQPRFITADGTRVLDSKSNMVNDQFQTGFSPVGTVC